MCDNPLTIQVPLIGETPEVQLMGALEHLCARHLSDNFRPFALGTDSDKALRKEVARAARWLLSKYGEPS